MYQKKREEEQTEQKKTNLMWLWQITDIINRSYDSYSVDRQLAVQVVATNTFADKLPHGKESIFKEENNQYSVETESVDANDIGFSVSIEREKWSFEENRNSPNFNVTLAEVGRELAKRRNRVFFQALYDTAGQTIESRKEGNLTKEILLEAISLIKKAGFTPNIIVIPPNQESNFKEIKEENKKIEAINNLAVYYSDHPNQVFLYDKNQILVASTILQAKFAEEDLNSPNPKKLIVEQKISCSSINSKALAKIACPSTVLKNNNTHISKRIKAKLIGCLYLGIEFSEVTEVDSQEFTEAIAIYNEALPAAERQTAETIRERVASKKEKLFIGYFNGEIVIMALIWPLNGSSFDLFDYFAVKKEYRSHGIGSSFLSHLFEITEFEDKTFVFEVDDPGYGDDREIRRRRVAFYSRNGAKQLKDVHYILPALQGTTTTNMILMVMSKDNQESLPGEVVKKVIKQIYRELYGRGEDNPLLNTFINTVPSKVDVVQAEVTK